MAAAGEEVRRTFQYVESLSDARTTLENFFNILLVAVWIGRPASRRRYAVHRTWWREPSRTIWSWLRLGVLAFRQSLIDHCFDFRLGQFGVFLSKFALKDWTGGCNIAFTGLSQPLTSQVIPCLAFFGPLTSYMVGSGSGSGIRIYRVFEAGFGTSSEQGQDESQSELHNYASCGFPFSHTSVIRLSHFLVTSDSMLTNTSRKCRGSVPYRYVDPHTSVGSGICHPIVTQS